VLTQRDLRPLSADALRLLRAERYRQRPHLRVQTEAQALEFLNDVGLCLLFSGQGLELPSLWGALCGEDRPVPQHHRDRNLGLAWSWKDTLPIQGKVLYGKFLRKKPVFVSLALASYFYALSPNYGDPAEDYMQDYLDGHLSVEAKQVYEVLLEQGALPTSRLRREAGLGGKSSASRFDRALAELQMQFRITKVAISDANRWGYAYVYDLFLRRFPGVPAAAHRISEEEAMVALLARYLRNVIAVPEAAARRLFRWETWEWDRVVERAATKGLILHDVRIEGLKGRCLATADG